MKALSILYHDVVVRDFEESGFPGEAAARYKFRRDEFDVHLQEMAKRARCPATTFDAGLAQQSGTPFFMTIDDGGVSAIYVAEQLERSEWRGHFFVTTDFIDTPAFISRDQIRWLRKRGHVIGSHSCSHPFRISEIPDEQLREEWRGSVEVLSEILGESVTVASVPGGFYAPRVTAAAAAAGIRLLFNSEPTMEIEKVDDCLVLGRFTVYRGLSARYAGKLAAGSRSVLRRQRLLWETKKVLKTVASPLWDEARQILFSKK